MSPQTELLKKWIEQGSALFDCRQANDYRIKHIVSSVSIPAGELYMRMQELPAKSQPFMVIVDRQVKELVEAFFQSRSLSLELILEWESLGSLPDEYYSSGSESVYYWRPSNFVSEYVTSELRQGFPEGASVLDVACGSGRDATFLALSGHRVTGVDYSTSALHRAKLTSEYHGVTLGLAQVDLETEPVTLPASIPSKYDVIIVCRYLHRPLFSKLKDWLLPGGLIAYQTFMQGAERFGSPKNPNFLLRPGELSDLFKDFVILRNEVVTLEDGRPVSAFIAKKPSTI